MNRAEIDWLLDSYLSNINYLSGVKTKENDISELIPSFFKQDYFSKIPNAFLSNIINKESLLSHPSWIVRDGLLSLRASVNNSKRNFYINEDVYKLLSKDEQRKFLNFRIVSNTIFNHNSPPTSVFIPIIASELFATSNEVEEGLRYLIQFLGKNAFKNIKIQLYIDCLKGDDDISTRRLLVDYGKLFYKYFENNWEIVRFEDISHYIPLRNTCYFEINSQLLISDTHIRHHILSRGGGLLEHSKKFNKNKEYLALSDNHGILLEKK